MRQPAWLAAGLALALFLLSRPVRAETVGNDTSDLPKPDNPGNVPLYDPPPLTPEQSNVLEPSPYNLSAFLYMIRSCEHVYPRDVQGGDNALAYTTFYGGERFSDLSDHPVITGELEPIKLSDAMCRAAGLGPGCVTSAAGAYQLIKPTWERLKKAKGAMQPLWDFSPASQDEAAVRLLDEIGATKLIQAGRIEDAIKVASKVWASLPGSTAQQNPKKLQYALDRFAEGLTLYGEDSPGLEL